MLGTALSVCSCGEKDGQQANEGQSVVENNNLSEENDVDSEDAGNTQSNMEGNCSFEELKGNQFVFASGAGAWSTEMVIGADGSFEGTYHDSDMGATGAGYPNGTRYFCEFTGQFTKPVKVNDYTYSVQISKIEYANEVGTEEILDEVLYCYSEAYGLEGAEEILIYLKGAPIEELPEAFMRWVKGSAYIEEGVSELPFYGLYNVAEECGFSSYNIKESLEKMVSFTEERAAELEDSIKNDDLSQMEYNLKTKELYDLWDADLNTIWRDLKNVLDEDAMDQLLTEQREWIKWKEAEVEKAGADYEGGSMQPMVMNQKAAELTKARVYELLEYFE